MIQIKLLTAREQGMTGATILAGTGAQARAGELHLPQVGPGPGFIQCFILCLECIPIAKQATVLASSLLM